MEAISFMIRHGSAKYMSVQRPLHVERTKPTVMDRKKETIDRKMDGDIKKNKEISEKPMERAIKEREREKKEQTKLTPILQSSCFSKT